ncbi:MAG TPA: HK97 family phage prohead protease, partial [Bacteroidales bacterium]|nr:HK97 family phage prohead protease [Bacteroidales bacterium]
MPDFVLNDQTQENAHGFYLRNEGGRFDRFRANPVLLHNHDENKLFGKWENLRIEGDKLVATPVFDQDDAEALKIQKKVDKGFLKGGSPGIIILNAELLTENGKDKVVVTEWELMEGSVVPVPSNRGSVCLYAPDGTRLKDDQVKLSLNELIN